MFLGFFSGDPLYVGFDLTIASFDSISEVSMVSYHFDFTTFLSDAMSITHTSVTAVVIRVV